MYLLEMTDGPWNLDNTDESEASTNLRKFIEEEGLTEVLKDSVNKAFQDAKNNTTPLNVMKVVYPEGFAKLMDKEPLFLIACDIAFIYHRLSSLVNELETLSATLSDHIQTYINRPPRPLPKQAAIIEFTDSLAGYRKKAETPQQKIAVTLFAWVFSLISAWSVFQTEKGKQDPAARTFADIYEVFNFHFREFVLIENLFSRLNAYHGKFAFVVKSYLEYEESRSEGIPGWEDLLQAVGVEVISPELRYQIRQEPQLAILNWKDLIEQDKENGVLLNQVKQAIALHLEDQIAQILHSRKREILDLIEDNPKSAHIGAVKEMLVRYGGLSKDSDLTVENLKEYLVAFEPDTQRSLGMDEVVERGVDSLRKSIVTLGDLVNVLKENYPLPFNN